MITPDQVRLYKKEQRRVARMSRRKDAREELDTIIRNYRWKKGQERLFKHDHTEDAFGCSLMSLRGGERKALIREYRDKGWEIEFDHLKGLWIFKSAYFRIKRVA
jgi:hypothetical protein